MQTLVIRDTNIIVNQPVIENFIKESRLGHKSHMRIAHFSDSDGPSFSDLLYDEDGYSFFYEDEDSLREKLYKHILVLEGKWGIPLRKSRMIVLSDDTELKFDEVKKAMISSSSVYINSVARHRIVIYNYSDFR